MAVSYYLTIVGSCSIYFDCLQRKAQELITKSAADRKAKEIEKFIPMIERQQEEQKEIRKKLMEVKAESFFKFILARRKITKDGDLPSTLGECNLPIVLKGL